MAASSVSIGVQSSFLGPGASAVDCFSLQLQYGWRASAAWRFPSHEFLLFEVGDAVSSLGASRFSMHNRCSLPGTLPCLECILSHDLNSPPPAVDRFPSEKSMTAFAFFLRRCLTFPYVMTSKKLPSFHPRAGADS